MKRDCVVVENDCGEAGVDGQLLSFGEGLAVREVTEGCICCSAKTDFASSVLTIANALDPELLVVEPSGAGRLGSILKNLQRIEYERITLLRPVTLVDARAFRTGIGEYPEICRDQIASAGTVLLTKSGGMDEGEREEIEREIRSINKAAVFVREDYRAFSDKWFEGLLKHPLTERISEREEVCAPESCAFTGISLASGYALLLFLEGVVSGVFGGIYRAKGHLKAGGVWLRFDAVDKRYTVTESAEMPDCRAMFVGKRLKRNLLRQALFREFRADASLLFNAPKKQMRREGLVKDRQKRIR